MLSLSLSFSLQVTDAGGVADAPSSDRGDTGDTAFADGGGSGDATGREGFWAGATEGVKDLAAWGLAKGLSMPGKMMPQRLLKATARQYRAQLPPSPLPEKPDATLERMIKQNEALALHNLKLDVRANKAEQV
jgi:hypothetical protein